MKHFSLLFLFFFTALFLSAQTKEVTNKEIIQVSPSLDPSAIEQAMNQQFLDSEAMYHAEQMQEFENAKRDTSFMENEATLSELTTDTFSMNEDEKSNFTNENLNAQIDFETLQDDSFFITELVPDISEFVPEKLIVTESVSNGEEKAFAQNLELSNKVSGSDTNVSYVATKVIVCENGFSATNGHTVLKIMEPDALTDSQNSLTSQMPSQDKGKSLEDIAMEKEINVYPNPASSELHIDFSSHVNGNVQLYDLSGKSVYQSNFNKEKSVEINLESLNLNKGIYILRVDTDSDKFSRKIIIQ